MGRCHGRELVAMTTPPPLGISPSCGLPLWNYCQEHSTQSRLTPASGGYETIRPGNLFSYTSIFDASGLSAWACPQLF